MLPVDQTETVIAGVTAYLSTERDLGFYIPGAMYADWTQQDIGQKKLVIRGEVNLSVENTALSKVRDTLGVRNIRPASYSHFSFHPPRLNISPPHEYLVQKIDGVPFPKFIFSATLNKEAQTYGETLEMVRRSWDAEQLLSDCFHMVIPSAKAKLMGDVKVNNLELRRVRGQTLPRNLTQSQVDQFIISAEASELVQVRVEHGDFDWAHSVLVQVARDYIVKHHFFPDIGKIIFREGESVSVWGQNETRGGDATWEVSRSVFQESSITVRF